MKFPAGYGIAVGCLMIAQWTASILAGGVPEFQTEPWRISFHLATEFSTAFLLILGGIAMLRSREWGRMVLLVGLGMVIYSEIVSPGYFAQLDQWPMLEEVRRKSIRSFVETNGKCTRVSAAGVIFFRAEKAHEKLRIMLL